MPDAAPVQAGDPESVNDYQVTERLGDSVYLARSPSGDRVVVRLLPADVDLDRFREAMEPLREIPAFCTAQVLDSGVDDGRPYIVSEYIDGPTLEETVASGGVLEAAALHRLAVGTMTALVAIHQAGTVHGDLRPGSVLFGPDGPRVIDLGMARALEATASTETRRVDVPAYTPPEKLRGASPEPAGDLFSWGATIAFAASGRSPFDAGSMSGTVNRIINDEPDLDALPDDLRGLVTACLAKDPARRPSASDALLRLVGELLTSDLMSVAHLSPAGPATRPVRRLRPLLLAAGAMAVALVSGARSTSACRGARRPSPRRAPYQAPHRVPRRVRSPPPSPPSPRAARTSPRLPSKRWRSPPRTSSWPGRASPCTRIRRTPSGWVAT
ncbi:Serine/threonine protein kinase [Streptosporangium subroseum]|uniref:Serine/threonine protein kinase n=1 Tax=Streptosporangium subroseum TaxID=106412 RepID=A0A239EQ17_9ACTN|nr:serine/threonine-protein kinase [Streptosporangium subroseum]SNS46679.1 Serine/threonine protein kinase [Streptosporangium subroseum]